MKRAVKRMPTTTITDDVDTQEITEMFEGREVVLQNEEKLTSEQLEEIFKDL